MSGLEDAAAAEDHANEVAELRAALRRTQGQLARAKAKRDELALVTVEACHEAVMSHGPLRPVVRRTRSCATDHAPDRDREHALLHMTDWQGAKRTTTYDSTVMRQRVMRYVDRVERIAEVQRSHHPVPAATVMLGGDMIEGLFNFPTQPYEIDATLFEQYVTVAMLLADVVRRLCATFDDVHVIAEWGNHGRLGSKRAAVPRNDNADRMIYELARHVLADEPRVTWEDCPEDVQRVQVGNYRAILLHGDEIGRNGYASPMTIVNHVARWSRARSAGTSATRTSGTTTPTTRGRCRMAWVRCTRPARPSPTTATPASIWRAPRSRRNGCTSSTPRRAG